MLRRRLIQVLLCVVLAGVLPPQYAQAVARKPHGSLKKQVETILAQPDLSRGFWGIEIASLRDGKVLYSSNANKLFTPASNTKLFTTAAALALIGPDYKFRTTFWRRGDIRDGTLFGSMIGQDL